MHRMLAAALVAAGFVSNAAAQTSFGDPSCVPAAAPGVSAQTLSSGGQERSYRLFVPPGHDGRSRMPLVLDLHGSGGTSAGQAGTSRFEALAAREGFLVATLEADENRRWNVPVTDGRADDVLYVSDVIDDAAARACADPARVYATGFSGGARMSSLLACRLGDRIAAIAPMAGLRWPGPCDGRAVPVLTFHGLADQVNTYDGHAEGRGAEWLESVPEALAGWAEHNGCDPDALAEDEPGPLSTLSYAGCDDGVEVRLVRIDGLGHTWARDEVDATAAMWEFFEGYSLPEDPAAQIPAEQTAAAHRDPDWRVSRFSWGDPNLEGTFTSRDMSGIPMERPEAYGTREHLTAAEFEARLNAPDRIAALAGNQPDEGRLQLSALDSAETGTRTFGYTSYIIDPEDGRMPALTEEGQARQAANRRSMNGPFYTTEDFSYYDRCISRGVTGSIGPSLYGDAMRIVQTPTEVAISYEMLHDTRIIPLDGRPPADAGVRQYMGSSVGHWEGDTLVVETTNFTDELGVGRMSHSEDLKLTERFTRIDPDMIDYVVTVDDPRTFARPWTFRLTLTTQPGYEVLEYSCHEGNFFIANALRAEKRYQQRVREAMADGEPIPERSTGIQGRSIFAPPAASEAVNINTTE